MRKQIIFFIAACIFMISCAPQPINYSKLDPMLRAALSNATPAEQKTKRYPCIVYTQTPEVLRKKGITIDSVLPTFVTARLTTHEVLMLCKLNEVTYIAGPNPDQLHVDDH